MGTKSKNQVEVKKTHSSSATKSLALSFYTFLSRILGLIRDHYMAVSFGTGFIASAFSVAYRLPNMYRNLLAEGTLSQSFMPLYSDASKVSEEEAKVMSGAMLSFLSFMLLLFVGLFVLFAPYLLPILVGGTEEYSNLVIELSLILFILIFTASLSSIFIAIANSKQKFFVPSLSPIILNLSYLFVFLVVFRFFDDTLERVKVLSFGIVTGGFLQLAVQVFYIRKLNLAPKINFQWKHPAIKKILTLMIPAVVGGGFYQISLLVDIFLANYIQNQNPGLGAVVSLDYSQRLIQLPTGIIGVALATTTLPGLLASLKEDKKDSIPNELAETLCFALYLTLPAAFGFIFMGETIVDAIFYGGNWDSKSTASTIQALQFYSIAIPVFSMNKILTSSYYAFKDTKTPLRINMISFSINISLNLILMNFLKHAGLALSSTIAAYGTFTFLFWKMQKHDIHISARQILHRLSRIMIPLSALMLWLLFVENLLPLSDFLNSKEIHLAHENLARLKATIGILPAIFLYFLFSKIANLHEFDLIFGKLMKKIMRK